MRIIQGSAVFKHLQSLAGVPKLLLVSSTRAHVRLDYDPVVHTVSIACGYNRYCINVHSTMELHYTDDKLELYLEDGVVIHMTAYLPRPISAHETYCLATKRKL